MKSKEEQLMAEQTIMWPGASGEQYRYWISDMNSSFKDEPGNYIFAKETSPNRWTPIYIGQTESLKNRLTDHEKLPCIKRHGGTHIHAHTTPGGEQVREAEEADLLAKWDPPCNKE
ncbi:hypothetical protein MYX82_03920 [Acidobacteria bacterium AH-259-D05]|nr:hypothetical protein [Acidobacteria bacterium AH-259-D05]